MDDVRFERDVLQRIAGDMRYPATPAMRARVLTAIADQRQAERGWGRAFPALAATAAVLAIAFGVALGNTDSREAIAEFFGIEGSTVDVVPTIPSAPTAEIDTNARPATVGDAASLAGFDPARPNGQAPNAVYIVDYGTNTGIILRYDGFDLWQVESGSFDGNFGKDVPSTGTVQDLTVNDVPARWITGAPHFVEYMDANGVPSQQSSRQVDRSTLIWRTDTALYRLETNLPLAGAVAIAETLP